MVSKATNASRHSSDWIPSTHANTLLQETSRSEGCSVASQGKCLNYGQTDTWSVYQSFVIGLKSDPDFTTEVLLAVGGIDSRVRRELLKRIATHKSQQAAIKKTMKYSIRRRMSQKIKVAQTEQDDAKKVHKSNKQAPTDDCKSGSTKKRTRKTGSCRNCGDSGHFAMDCPEPSYKREPKRRKGVASEKEILHMFSKRK